MKLLWNAIAVTILGAGVTLALGGGLPAETMIVEWAVWSVVMMALGSLFVIILQYALPSQRETYRYISIATGVVLMAITVAAEWLTVRFAMEQTLPLIPARVIITLLVYTILWLQFSQKKEPEQPVTPSVEMSKPQINTIERITLRTGGKIRVLTVSEIIYLRADGDYVEIVAADGRWLKEQTMKWFEENLPACDFLRIHRSCIVNLAHIARIERYGTQYHVQLNGGETLAVSAAGYKLLREKLAL